MLSIKCNNATGVCDNEDCRTIGCCQVSTSSPLPATRRCPKTHRTCTDDDCRDHCLKATPAVAKAPKAAKPTAPAQPTPAAPAKPLPSTPEMNAAIASDRELGNTIKRREEWLHQLADRMVDLFEPQFEVPKNLRISCGFPSRKALITDSGKHALGECWTDEKSEDKHFEIFISPVLGRDLFKVAGVLAHEMVHAVVGLDAKHGARFKKAALYIGLAGKMSATTETDEFRDRVAPMIDAIGPYPHAMLDARKMTNGIKKQTTRLLKVECPDCGYTVRMAKKWIDEVGTPDCRRCEIGMVEADVTEGA